MPASFTCIRGHEWQLESDAGAADPPRCPVCDGPAFAAGTAGAGKTPNPAIETLPPSADDPGRRKTDVDVWETRLPDGSTAPVETAPWDGPLAARFGLESAEASELYGFLAPAQEPDEIGRLGPYRVLEVLGAGGMGVVFRAEDPQLRRAIALKTMLPSLAANSASRRRFLREAQAAAALEHDHIVTIYQVGEERGLPFLAMPLLKGESLEERVKREGRLPAIEVQRIGREVAEGLSAAHERGLIHRDIKPANIWLEGSRRRVKILDFGLARFTGDSAQVTQAGVIVGTPAYMAPEQAAGKGTDHLSDLFSLGSVLYRMATGQPPFRGADTISTLLAVAHEQPRAPAEVSPDLPPALSDLIMHLLEKDPARRPPSAQALVAALQDLGRGPVVVPPASPPTERIPPTPGRSDRLPNTGVGTPIPHRAKPRPPVPAPAVARPSAARAAAKVFLGCGIVALLFVALLGGGIYWLVFQGGPRLMEALKEEMEHQRGWDEVARFWRPPPPDAGPEILFPAQVATSRLAGHDTRANIPELNIEAQGHHASYGAGPGSLDVFAYRASQLEKEALYKRALEVLLPKKDKDERNRWEEPAKENTYTSYSISGSAQSSRIIYSVSPPSRRGILWWDKGWLFVVNSPGHQDPEDFLKKYLETLSGRDQPK